MAELSPFKRSGIGSNPIILTILKTPENREFRESFHFLKFRTMKMKIRSASFFQQGGSQGWLFCLLISFLNIFIKRPALRR